MIRNNISLGTVRQYRLFRAHVNFGTDSMLYPYDTQTPSLKFQSLDYGGNTIHISTKTLNNLNGFDPKLLSVEGLESLSNIQGRSDNYEMLYLIAYYMLHISYMTSAHIGYRFDMLCDKAHTTRQIVKSSKA